MRLHQLTKRTALFLAFLILPHLSCCADSKEANTTAVTSNNKGTAQTVTFSPPAGWRQAEADFLSANGRQEEAKTLPSHVKLMVVGKGKKEFPPSINLAIEPFKGSLKDYLKIIKSINQAKGSDWKDLGKIKTKAGEGSLSQLDTKLQWGNVRMLHTIVAKNGMIYIMTAAALREEFPSYYKQFFEAMSSLQVNEETP